MELRIQTIHFDATEKLEAFTEKKIKKLEKFNDEIIKAEVILKVIKPESIKNKEAAVKLGLKNGEAFASKTADTFEEAIDLCAEALEKQLIKNKTKKER